VSEVVFHCLDCRSWTGPCGHLWRDNDKGVMSNKFTCPVCTKIKAAREEVLDLAGKHLRLPVTFTSEAQWKVFMEAYDKRFGHESA